MINKKQLTFISLFSNDDEMERKRIRLFLASLVNQIGDIHKVIVWDFSNKEPIKLPENNIITVIQEPKKQINLAEMRNICAIKADTPYIAHVNADCVYSPYLTTHTVKILKEHSNWLVQCNRSDITGNELKIINSYEKALDMGKKRKNFKKAAGDFQALRRDLFLKIGGYYNMILPDLTIDYNKVNDDTAYSEDCHLSVMAENHLDGIFKHYLDTSHEEIWIMHLWHEIRRSKKEYSERLSKPVGLNDTGIRVTKKKKQDSRPSYLMD